MPGGVSDRCAACPESTAIDVGARGALAGRPFTLTGYAHARSAHGGHWNEWRALFDDGAIGWLIEAAGAFRMLFERDGLVPPIDAASPGDVFVPRWVAVERGEATRAFVRGDAGGAAAGETYAYVDLSAAGGASATLEAGGAAFVGAARALAELGVAPRACAPRWIPVDEEAALGFEPPLAVGAEVRLEGAKMRVVGAVERSAPDGARRHVWQEHCLYHALIGIRWLVVSDGHWTLARAVDPGDVDVRDAGVVHDGALYRLVGRDRARVDRAAGELPWDVAIGHEVETADFARPPRLLSSEIASFAAGAEVTWSLGTYLPSVALRAAVGPIALPRLRGRAPHQPRTR